MMKLNIAGQAEIKQIIDVTPEGLRSIAHQLEGAAKFAGPFQAVQLDITSGGYIITMSYAPPKSTAAKLEELDTEDLIRNAQLTYDNHSALQ